ncbi:receptor like protein 30-like [Cucumis melo var. makuwa]|uniref:Receptor like protein 30-like n=1 Tax=Cucumis melo var. makuwa TaxID=1194695 RepID=A0A5D3DLQ8_CUCMM|nr:receptor like protein 30-like [Cucumis melo var. makuwa]
MAVVMMCCYFFLLFLFLSNISLIVNSQLHHHHHHHVCDPKQSLALHQFKNAFFQPTPTSSSSCGQYLHDSTFYESTPHYRLSKWNENTDCCLWDGVECDDKGQGHVVGLHLGCSLLQGILHPNSTLFTLSHLKTLNLSFNDFSGSPISPQFGIMLTNLRVLDLSYSFFQGQVPMQMSYLSNLVSLNLSHNYDDLSFSNVVINRLVHNLTNLKDFKLASTDLSHVTPTSFINLSLSLRSLDLSYSSLSGNFPNHIFSLPNLNVLNLYSNLELDGHLPMSNWSKSVQILDLSFTNFSGGIPNSISEAKVLSYLNLGFCNFNGKIPYFLRNQKNLGRLDLSNNQIEGKIPEWFFELGDLMFLDLSHNSLSGELPSCLSNMTELHTLILKSNNFSGVIPIPPPSIVIYIASENQFVGKIPHSICLALDLQILSLSNNRMSGGTIPSCLTNITFLSDQQCVHDSLEDGNSYQSTAHYRLSKWNESTDCCLWDGVECDDEGQGHVVGLHLGCSLLQGPLHPNSTLFTLSHLKTLNLSFNDFSGSPISPQFGIMLTNLRVLDLSYSFFQGQVPMQIPYLSNLVSLNLSHNYDLSFSNVVMNRLVQNLTNLKDFKLAFTDLSHITPTSFINFSLSLKSLDLSYSYLSGNFPNHIFSLPNLNVLNLEFNFKLNGHLPMSNWSKSLQILDLHRTSFSGGIPNSISEAKVLSYLNLGFCNFNGEIPNFETHSNPLITSQLVPNCVFNNITQQTWPSNSFTNVCTNTPLPNLIHVVLSTNSFTGIIPSWIYLLPNLKYLNLGSNNFSGFMEDFRSNSLEYLVLSNNNLQGEISKSIYRQPNLIYLGLNSNNISGVLNLDMLLRIPSLWNLQISNNSQLSIFSTNVSSLNLIIIGMASLNNLGKIPYFLRNQKNLLRLDLSNNQIEGKIPEWFFELGNLMFLDLSHNSLSGELPSCLSNMTKLRTLILKSNNFSGVIPIPPPSIVIYIASENQFVGKIPHSICLALDLQILSLSNNRISGGTIPSCLTNITSLSVLDLKGNNFIGTIPTTLFPSGCQLRSLDLNDNQIEGELPQSLLNCKHLQVLDLGNNNITGYFPYWLKTVLDLQVLILRSNRFYGHINNSFTKDSFSNLRIIDLSRNYFSGPLPSKFFNMRAIQKVENQKSNSFFGDDYYRDSIVISLKGLEQKLERILLIFKTIDLSSNGFSGEIPKEIGKLRSLVGLNLSNNKLTGEIPTSLGNLNNLEWLDLSSNELCGNIPPQLVGLTFLSHLNLSSNHLSGPIPQGNQFDTFESFSYFGNLGLCGKPLPNCDAGYPKDHKYQPLYEEEEEGDGFEKGIWVKAVFMGYGCGIVFGTFIGYLVFHHRKPMWIVARVEGKRARKIQTSMRSRRP